MSTLTDVSGIRTSMRQEPLSHSSYHQEMINIETE